MRFEQIQYIVLGRASVILKLWCFSSFFLLFSFTFTKQMLDVYRFSFCISADENVFCFFLSKCNSCLKVCQSTNHLTNGTAKRFQCFYVCRYIFPHQQMGQHNITWSKLQCSNLPQVQMLPRGPPSSWGTKCFGSLRGCKEAREADN